MKTLGLLINELTTLYPEKIQPIDELFCNALSLRYDVTDKDDAVTAIHTVRDSLKSLWYAVDNEDLNNRDITDRAYAEIIVNIKNILAAIEWVIDSDIQDTIYKYDLYIA